SGSAAPPHLQRLPQPDDAAALAALQRSEADVAVVSVFAARTLLAGGWRTASLAPRPYVIAVRKADQRLLSEINHNINQMEQDGTLERLFSKWVK
ncbi:MAG: transporter substrate-binding domain-containing protein, partial [Anaerolineae bacterium]|nr:transporter substrate-binding domain-containing protein [Anaerolineae bacterium]